MRKFKESLRCFLAFMLAYSGLLQLQNALRNRRRNSIRIICYHSVGEKERESFERQIRYYSSKYNIISLTHAVNMINSRQITHSRNLVITFDDSFKDNYQIAAPILQKYSVPACFFVVSDFVSVAKKDKAKLEHFCQKVFYTNIPKRNMDWKEVRELSRLGFEIGSHTNTHPFLTKLPIAEARREILESKRAIENKIGRPVRHFAFPYGTAKDFNYRLMRFVEEAGYASCCSAVKGKNSIHSDTHYLSRNVILPGWPLFMMKCSIQGGFDWIETARSLFEDRRLSRQSLYRNQVFE